MKLAVVGSLFFIMLMIYLIGPEFLLNWAVVIPYLIVMIVLLVILVDDILRRMRKKNTE